MQVNKMKEKIILRNIDIKRVLIGVPENHKHLRVIIETDQKIIVFYEAAIANIVRGFTIIKTHPIIEALELEARKVEEGKKSFAEIQLIETSKKKEDIIKEINNLI
jgi:hypothetical protein